MTMETVQQKKQMYAKQLADHTFRQYQLAWNEKELKTKSDGRGRESENPSSSQAAKDRRIKRTPPKETNTLERNQHGVRNRGTGLLLGPGRAQLTFPSTVVQARDFAVDLMKGHSNQANERPSER